MKIPQLQIRRENTVMAAAMKHNGSTASHESDRNAMEPAHVGEALLSTKSKSTWVSKFVKNVEAARSKSTFTYIFIGFGLLICLVWSATLFWFLVRGLLRVIF